MKYKIGDVVRFVSEYARNKSSYYYPAYGTIGTVWLVDVNDHEFPYKIQWPDGATGGSGKWWVQECWIEPVTSEDDSDDIELDVDIMSLLSEGTT